MPAIAPEVKPDQLKKTSDFRLIGKDVLRVELPDKVNGSAQYSIDVQVPGMIYGAVLRSPVEGGARQIVRRSQGEGDHRRHLYRAVCLTASASRGHAVGRLCRQGGARASISWDRTGTAWGFDSDKGMDAFAARCAKSGRPVTKDWFKQGDAEGELAKAATTVEAEYRCDYAYHAQMEPLNALASVSPDGDSVEVWCGTQSQTMAVEAPAKALGIPRDKVTLHYTLLGGGFGRRGHRDEEFIVDAVLLSKEAKRPVKVMWTREDDVHNGRLRPIYGALSARRARCCWQDRRLASTLAGDRVPRFRIRCATSAPGKRISS